MIGLSASEIASQVRAGRLSAKTAVEAALRRIDQIDGHINAFTDLTRNRALREAALIDAIVAAGQDPGPLAGVPFAVKNLFDIEGLPTRAGAKINRNNAPAATDAALVKRLAEQGAILLGALNMGEYAYDFTGQNCHDGNCQNPHDLGRMTGGSSSGTAAAVASGMVPLALGTDTNGSIRVPAALCGVFGLKPTYGLLSRQGIFPLCDSLDHAGLMTRTVTDLALAFDVMSGRDAVSPRLPDGVGGLRIAQAGGYFRQGGTKEVHAAVEQVAAALAVTREAVLPEAARARAAAYIITTVESSALHLDRLRTRAADFDPDTRFRFLSGACLPGGWYVKAQHFRRWFHDRAMELFADLDLLLAPATPCAAPDSSETMLRLGDREVPLRPNFGIFTQPISFIGFPAAVVPLHRPGQLPLGVQIIGAPGREDSVLRAAYALEQSGLARAPSAEIAA